MAQERLGDSARIAELQVLDRYVGTWLHDVTLLPSKSTPSKTTERVTEQTEWVLNDSFIMGREVNATSGSKSLWFFTVSRGDRKTYPFWYFDSRGIIGLWNGQWDESSKTMTFTPTDMPPGWRGVATHVFDDASYVSSMTITDDAGEKVIYSHDKKTRQAGIAGQRMLEAWNKVGTPPAPVPNELKRLEPFIGEWDTEFINRPSVVSPRGGKSSGSMTARWILDGRCVLGTTEVGNHRSMWVISYDTNQKAYRYLRFTDTGLIDESTGQWNEETRSLVWTLVSAPPGITRTSTTRFTGNDGTVNQILAKNREGKV